MCRLFSSSWPSYSLVPLKPHNQQAGSSQLICVFHQTSFSGHDARAQSFLTPTLPPPLALLPASTTHTPNQHRIELFKPHYILGPRPTWAYVPSQVEFGSTFTVTLAANTSVADIVAVVLSDTGTTTHASNMAARSMKLAFSAAGGQALTVSAPVNIHVAQPGFYLLFAVARNDSYSVGSWLRLKGPWGSRPFSLPAPSQFVTAASSQFEVNFGESSQHTV